MLVTCECNSLECKRQVDLTAKQVGSYQSRGLVLIVDGCPHGPNADDVFVESGEGYKLYQPHFKIKPEDLDLIS